MVNSTGCTGNLCLITKDMKIYCTNIADSRCVLGVDDGSGNIVNLDMSVDHKPSQEAEKIRIEKAGGTVIDDRVDGNLNLSRSLGDLHYKRDPKLKAEE